MHQIVIVAVRYSIEVRFMKQQNQENTQLS